MLSFNIHQKWSVYLIEPKGFPSIHKQIVCTHTHLNTQEENSTVAPALESNGVHDSIYFFALQLIWTLAKTMVSNIPLSREEVSQLKHSSSGESRTESKGCSNNSISHLGRGSFSF